MDNEFKDCSKCSGKMNVLDDHVFCYKHRLCNEAFPCDTCRTWSKERRDKITKMIGKSLQKTIKMNNKVPQSVCGDGTAVQDTSPSVEAAVRGTSNIEESHVGNFNNDGSVSEVVNLSDIIQDQVRQHLELLLKRKDVDINFNDQHTVTANEIRTTGKNESAISKMATIDRPHFDKFKAYDEQMSSFESSAADVLSVNAQDNDFEDIDSNASMAGMCTISDAPVEVPFGAPDSSDPLQWNCFVSKMAKVLNIDIEAEDPLENERKSFISSRLKGDKSDKKKSLVKMPIEGTLIDMIKTVEKEATSGHLKNRSVRGRDDKAFMVKKDDFDAFCNPPKLDDNIEEGLVAGQKGNFGKSKVSLSPFHKELDNDFRRIDNSARALFRAISYGTMIAAFLDEAECEDDKIEGRKALINCFRSMADLTARVMANSVLSRRKVFLKNVDFISKATEKKLLKLPIFGSQLFNGQYFESLHTSAENLRDARETQNVYNTSKGFNKNYKGRDNRNSTEFGRKRKADVAETQKSAKISKLNDASFTLTDQGKDTFRTGQESRRYPFSRKTFGGPKGFPPPRK